MASFVVPWRVTIHRAQGRGQNWGLWKFWAPERASGASGATGSRLSPEEEGVMCGRYVLSGSYLTLVYLNSGPVFAEPVHR